MSVEEEFVFESLVIGVKEEKSKLDTKPGIQSENPDKIRWGTIIPLIGGSALGCEKSAGSLPEFHLSYTPFANNEQHLKRYWPEVPFHYLDKNPVVNFEGVDYINSVCPCAGLSMLNTSTTKGSKRGSDSAANKWMLDSSIYVLSKVRPKVLWGENAPGLFTNIGEGVVQKLREIGQQFGYSFSVMKTSTEMHGIPQRRVRTFYFFWNTPTVPMMTYQRRERKDLMSYLKEIPKDATQQNMFMAEGKASQRFRPYQFVLEREGLTHAEFGKKFGKGTISTYLEEKNLIPECIDWLNAKYPGEAFWNQREGTRTHVEYLQHIVKKRQGGFGYWDDSPRFMDGDSFAAVMKKTMMWAVHPEEDRFLNAREFMHLMGLPHDFEIDDVKNLNHIAQNVPTNTARDMAEQVKQFIKGELKMTEYSFVKQCNMSRSMVYAEKGKISPVSKEEILEMERTGAFKIPEAIQTQEKNIVRPRKEKKTKVPLTEEDLEIVRQKKEKKTRVPLTEEELEIRRIEREMVKEKLREEKRLDKEERVRKREELRAGSSLSPEEMEERREQIRKSQEERDAKREERRKDIEKRKEERREARKSEVVEVDLAEITEEMKKFMCYICKIFPRPGSYNRSELYRHYALVHFAQDLKKDYQKKYAFPCLCPFCPKESARMLDGKDIVNHIGQVHGKVEDYLPTEYHLSGSVRRRTSTFTASIKMEIEESLVKREGALIKREEEKEIKNTVKKEEPDESNNVNRRRSSRLSNTGSINYEEDALLKECEKRGKEELRIKKYVKKELEDPETDVVESDQEEEKDQTRRHSRSVSKKEDKKVKRGRSSNKSPEQEKDEEDIIEVKTRSGRRIKPVIEVPQKVVKNTRSGRRGQTDDSEDDEVEVREVRQTRKKRKSTDLEEIEIGEDVKTTRSGRIIREVIKDEPTDSNERKTRSGKRLSDTFEDKRNRSSKKGKLLVESDSDGEEVEVKIEKDEIKKEEEEIKNDVKFEDVKDEEELKDIKHENEALDSSLELEELETSLSNRKQNINSLGVTLSTVDAVA